MSDPWVIDIQFVGTDDEVSEAIDWLCDNLPEQFEQDGSVDVGATKVNYMNLIETENRPPPPNFGEFWKPVRTVCLFKRRWPFGYCGVLVDENGECRKHGFKE